MRIHHAGTSRQARRKRGLRRLALVALTVLLGAVVVPLALPDHDGVTRAAARVRGDEPVWAIRELAGANVDSVRAEVSLPSAGGGIAVPRSYLGISTEYWTIPLYVSHMSVLERVLALVHVPGDGPLILRIGGDSADHSFWDLPAQRTAPWIFRVTPAWLRQVRTIVERGGVRLILDLNLVTDSPSSAAQWARAAENGLPRGALAGLEIGNEPDIYNRWFWLATLARTNLLDGLLPAVISGQSYTADFQLYARALARATPGLPLVGPALANPVLNIGWFKTLLAHARSRVGMLSGHQYPYSACVPRRSPAYPSIAKILSPAASSGIAHKLGPVIALAHRAGLPLRLTELNSVTCGGVPGISNSFATALWAPDTLFALLRAGLDGVNVHVRERPINAAFVFNARGLLARPLLYGMILFAQTLGPDAHVLPVHVDTSPSLGLKVWAVRVRGRILHLLLIDKGQHNVRVLLRIPASGPATVERLLAPSAGATSDPLLGGQWLGRRAQWLGARYSETIRPGRGGYEVTLPRQSAALVRVRLRPIAPNRGSAAVSRRSLRRRERTLHRALASHTKRKTRR